MIPLSYVIIILIMLQPRPLVNLAINFRYVKCRQVQVSGEYSWRRSSCELTEKASHLLVRYKLRYFCMHFK